MDTLPIELIVQIGCCSAEAWRGMLSVRSFAEWSCTNSGKKTSDDLFCKKYDGKMGNVVYTKNNLYHNIDKASQFICDDIGLTFQFWYRNGKLHCEDGPAYTSRNNDGDLCLVMWFRKGLLHREDGPALTYTAPNNTKIEYWYRDGFLHREDGPAVYTSKYIFYFKNGTLHRDGDLPAIIALLKNKYVTDLRSTKFFAEEGILKKRFCYEHRATTFAEKFIISPPIPGEFSTPYLHKLSHLTSCTEGNIEEPEDAISRGAKCSSRYIYFGHKKIVLWLRKNEEFITAADRSNFVCSTGKQYVKVRNGMIHCDDGPAAQIGRTLYWCHEGLLHRVDGPAILSSGRAEWYLYGQLHREDGPAVQTKKINLFYRRGLKQNFTAFDVATKLICTIHCYAGSAEIYYFYHDHISAFHFIRTKKIILGDYDLRAKINSMLGL